MRQVGVDFAIYQTVVSKEVITYCYLGETPFCISGVVDVRFIISVEMLMVHQNVPETVEDRDSCRG